jgi:hypothetical protein
MSSAIRERSSREASEETRDGDTGVALLSLSLSL